MREERGRFGRKVLGKGLKSTRSGIENLYLGSLLLENLFLGALLLLFLEEKNKIPSTSLTGKDMEDSEKATS